MRLFDRIFSIIRLRVGKYFFKTILFILNLKNLNKKKMLIFTDSRGFEVTDKSNRFNFINSYFIYLINKYKVTVKICPEKHTTLMDFIYYLTKNKNKFDLVLFNVGVVDFSPRPLSQIEGIFNKKKKKIEYFFDYDEFLKVNLRERKYLEEYFGEPTVNLYDIKYFKEKIVPLFTQFDNLWWINSNRVLEYWQGNYGKPRPKNMDIILQYDLLLKPAIKNVIDISNWSDSEIQYFTCDNIHFSFYGFLEIAKLLHKKGL